MKFGLIPAYQIAPVETPEYAAGLGRLAESLGFESIWPVEHVVMPADYASRYPYARSGRMPIPDAAIPDPLIWNAWVAASTRRLRVSTGILILPQHNPVVLAKTLATLDRLSEGRSMLGVGVGWLREEAEAVGSGWHDRGRRTDEAIEAMRALWTQAVASYEGETVRFRGVKCRPRPLQRAGVPIHVGGHSLAAARRAGRLGDGFMPLGGGPDTLDLATLREEMEIAARDAGRDADAIEITCLGTPDPEAVRALADQGVHRVVVAALEPDLEATRKVMGRFSEQAIGRLG